jgi:superfamily II DNA helicase RecQ
LLALLACSLLLQAGCAGRDGVPSWCTLLWSSADAAKNAIIKVCPTCRACSAATRIGSADYICLLA